VASLQTARNRRQETLLSVSCVVGTFRRLAQFHIPANVRALASVDVSLLIYTASFHVPSDSFFAAATEIIFEALNVPESLGPLCHVKCPGMTPGPRGN
jgi:hypothetical protein